MYVLWRSMYMNVVGVKISGYKNLSHVQINFNHITSLVSVNNYGKSNVLTGLVFGFRFIQNSEEEKDRMMSQNNLKPLNRYNTNECFSFEVEFSYQEQIIKYGYSFDWNKKEIIEEHLMIRESSQKFTNYIKRNIEAYYKPSLTGACNKNIKIEKNELVINKLKAFDDLFYLDIIKEINQVRMYIDRHFDVSRSYGRLYTYKNEKNNLKYNLANDNNIPMILFEIKKSYPNKYQLIINTFKKLFTNIQSMEILEVEAKMNKDNEDLLFGKFYTIAIIDKNIEQPIDFLLMSDGARKILLVLTNLVLAEINQYSLVAIEEPENSLNPKILQEYLIILNSFTEHTKIMITSHSPYLVNYLPPENIYLGLPNENGLAVFAKVKDSMVNKVMDDAEKLNMYTGDYLFDLMSGGEEGLKQIEKYVK